MSKEKFLRDAIVNLENRNDKLEDLYEAEMARCDKLEAERDALKEALYDLLNDCINFDDGNLTEAIMKRASDLLKDDRG